MPDPQPEELFQINELAEAEAQVNNFLCAPREFTKLFRLGVEKVGSTRVIMIPELDQALFNRILGLGVSEPVTEIMLDNVIALFKTAGCKNYMVQVTSLTQPAEYPEWLSKRGFEPRRKLIKMYRGTEPAPSVSTDLRVTKIGMDQANAYVNVMLPVFGLSPILHPLMKGSVGKPGWHHYVAFDGDKPVSAATMFIHGDVAWMGWASTLETHRRRGGQTAIGARMIQDGLALGCKWFSAETREDMPEHPNPSYHNMLRYGFKPTYVTRNYVHQTQESLIRKVRRTFFIATYSLKLER